MSDTVTTATSQTLTPANSPAYSMISSSTILPLLSLLSSSCSHHPRDPYTWLNRFNLPPSSRDHRSVKGASVFQVNYEKTGLTGFHKAEKIKPFQFNFQRGIRSFHQRLPSERQSLAAGGARAGCQTPSGFRRGGETWQMPGCRRGVCAITLGGGWQTQEDSCDGLLQNPQYQCVLDQDQRFPFPDCCARSVQCREVGPRPQQ